MSTIWGFVFFALYHAALAKVPNVEPEYLSMLRAAGRHEEFAKLLGIEDVNLVLPVEGRTEEEILFNNVSPLGDILLTPEQEEQARQGINFRRYPGNKWPRNEIPYSIEERDFTRSEVSNIETAINSFNSRNARLRLVKRQNQEDYVLVFSGNGCYSYLGKTGGQQPISLQKRTSCLSSGTVQHEFLHAAGFLHEHARPDRDNHVKVLYENIPREWHSQYNKGSSNDFDIHGPYDPHSVMHYPMRAPGSGKPAFEFHDKTVNTARVGQRDGPTSTDMQKVNNLYS